MQSSMEIGPVLLEALGIDATNVIDATIELKTDQPVYVTLKQFAKAPNLDTGFDKLKTEIKRFGLVELKTIEGYMIDGFDVRNVQDPPQDE